MTSRARPLLSSSELLHPHPLLLFYLLKELQALFPLILLLSIWASDIFAYGIGKKFGKHPLAPRISPKKTIEGLMGATLGSLIVITASHQLLGLSVPAALGVGAATGVLGQAGDLLESACKRVFNTKDSSQLIPARRYSGPYPTASSSRPLPLHLSGMDEIPMKKKSSFGFHGSIGTATLDVIANDPGAFEVAVSACRNNIELLNRQINPL